MHLQVYKLRLSSLDGILHCECFAGFPRASEACLIGVKALLFKQLGETAPKGTTVVRPVILDVLCLLVGAVLHSLLS